MYSTFMSVPTKRRRMRVRVTVNRQAVTRAWPEILRVWTTLNNMPPLTDDCNHKGSRFVVFTGQPNEIVVTVSQIPSQGLHSEIFEIEVDGVKRPCLLKKFNSHTSENVPPMIEAKLQIYAHRHGLAPAVLAFNEHAMIVERCESELTSKDLSDGYKWRSKMPMEPRRKLSTLNHALGTGVQKIRKFARTMYKKIGLYNMDPNIDNYMLLRGKLVQIDFGMNRFDSEAAFQRWCSSTGQCKEHKSLLVPKDKPRYPPDFYWYETFVYPHDKEKDKTSWSQDEWTLYNSDMCETRKTLIKSLQGAKTKGIFKVHCVADN